MNHMAEKIEPMEIDIAVKDVVKRYPVTEATEIVRCRTSIFFHSTCFWVVSKPTVANNGRGGALYEMLTWYCDYKDNRDTFSAEEQQTYDTLCDMVINILTVPLDIFTDMDYCLDVAQSIIEKRSAFYERLAQEASVEREETEADAIANAEFEEDVRLAEQLGREIEELEAMRKSRS